MTTQSDLDTLYEVAYYSYLNGKYKKAERFFYALVHLVGTQVDYWFGLAASQQMQKKYNEAHHSYFIATVLNPKNPHLYMHAAECLKDVGKHYEALQTLKAGLRVAKEVEDTPTVKKLRLLKKCWSH